MVWLNQRGAGIGIFFISLVVFTLFTVLLGSGLLFYQDNIGPAVRHSYEDPSLAFLRQGTIMSVSLLFAGSAILFLMASIKWVGQNR